jgi:hypothetical protein
LFFEAWSNRHQIGANAASLMVRLAAAESLPKLLPRPELLLRSVVIFTR